MEYYSMKEIMQITNLSSDTLRYYEKDGILSEINRLPNGHRRYTKQNLEWLKFINCLKSTGMPLKKIKEYRDLMNLGDATTSKRKDIMQNQKQKILDDMKSLEEALKTINWKIEYYQTVEDSLK